MNNITAQPSLAQTVATRASRYASSIRIWESLFTLPFCFIGMVLAAQGWPGWHAFIWINVAMFGGQPRKGPGEGYHRGWPPDIAMSPEIKALVDRRWAEYGL